MKQLLFAVFVMAASILQAQTINVQFSEKFSVRDRDQTAKEGTTFRVGDFYYAMEIDYKGMQFAYTAKLDKIRYGININKHDGNMKQLGKGSLQAGEKAFGPFPPRMTLLAGKMLLLYYQAQADGTIQLLCSTIDPESLAISPGKLLYTISEKNVGLFKMETAVLSNSLQFCLSPDSSALLVSQSGNTNEIFSCLVHADLSIEKPVVSKVKVNVEQFKITHVLLDGAGNRYFTYSFKDDLAKKGDVFVLNASGKEAFLSLHGAAEGGVPGMLNLQLSKENGKAFVYGTSSVEHLEEGVIAATIDANALKLGKPLLYSLPTELKDRLHKMSYTQKHFDVDYEKEVYYRSTLLNDGTLVLTGYPIADVHPSPMMQPGQHYAASVARLYAGPIINIFIKEGDVHIAVIYRNQKMSPASIPILIPYGNKLLCIYTDSEKSINSNESRMNDNIKDAGELALAMAVLDSDGTVISKKKIADRMYGANYFLGSMQQVTANSYVVPLGHEEANLMRFYEELEGWATLNVE